MVIRAASLGTLRQLPSVVWLCHARGSVRGDVLSYSGMLNDWARHGLERLK